MRKPMYEKFFKDFVNYNLTKQESEELQKIFPTAG
jgi:hypothetical protein